VNEPVEDCEDEMRYRRRRGANARRALVLDDGGAPALAVLAHVQQIPLLVVESGQTTKSSMMDSCVRTSLGAQERSRPRVRARARPACAGIGSSGWRSHFRRAL
jgi:hypothetical protein